MWGQIALSLKEGNVYLIAILALGFLCTVVIFERFIMLQFVYNMDFKKFLNHLKRSVQAEDLDRAISICKNASNTSLPAIGLKALEAVERDPATVRGTIEEETLDFLPKVESRIGILPAIATLILLIGILGTIDSLWAIFESIQVLDTTEKQARLANGVAESLNPTTVGLLMSMIFLTGHYIIRGLAFRLTESLQYGVSVLTHLLAPQDVTTYIPAAVGQTIATAPPMQETRREMVNENKVEDSDDNFNDASVEDIKDEEEII